VSDAPQPQPPGAVDDLTPHGARPDETEPPTVKPL
jgi:hypothetical protein